MCLAYGTSDSESGDLQLKNDLFTFFLHCM